jgi:hypothetical protein
MITTQHPHDSTTTPDHAPPIREYLTPRLIPPRITTRNSWHTDASPMQGKPRRAAGRVYARTRSERVVSRNARGSRIQIRRPRISRVRYDQCRNSVYREHAFTRAPRLTTQHHPSATRPYSRNHDTLPAPDRQPARDNLTFLVTHCTEFQHALAFEMRAAVVAGVASC